jgi:lysophospholipase L1-like esterase
MIFDSCRNDAPAVLSVEFEVRPRGGCQSRLTNHSRPAGKLPMSAKLSLLALLTVATTGLRAATPLNAAALLPEGARLAVVGDSITEQKQYTRFIEAYLIACAGRPDVKVFQFGWGGETAGGFAQRAMNDLAVFKPTTVTLCYGMNDGGYRPFDENVGKGYTDSMRSVMTVLKDIGVPHVVVGSPGAVDTFFFKRDNFAPKSGADGYNDNLRQLGEIGKTLAGEFQQTFADVHQPMIDAMRMAKPALGENYDVCGGDGFHPNANGHLVMAMAFLKALGCDGNIGEIAIDMNGPAKASDGHKILTSGPGTAEFESTRYPFCFQGDEKSSSGTRSIVPFVPFNQDLNRFTLKVANLPSARASVTWGSATKEFTKEQLGAGINLAAEFPVTPFDANFAAYLGQLGGKQQFETLLIKELVTRFRAFDGEAKADPEVAAAFATLRKKLPARQAALDTQARQALAPVKHGLKVTPL